MSDSRRGFPGANDDPGGYGGGSGAPAAGTVGEVPAAAVLSATARASTAYTASAAQSAATALVRMFVGQGTFAPELWGPPEAPGTVPADPVDSDAQPAGPGRIRTAVGPVPGDGRPNGHPAACTGPVRAVRAPFRSSPEDAANGGDRGGSATRPRRVVHADGGSR